MPGMLLPAPCSMNASPERERARARARACEVLQDKIKCLILKCLVRDKGVVAQVCGSKVAQ